jgi:hypothetical protein
MSDILEAVQRKRQCVYTEGDLLNVQVHEHDALLEKLLTLVTLAQAGLDRGKPYITEYQIGRMYDLLGEN